MKFEWALEKLAHGMKVRQKSWDNPNSYIKMHDNLIWCHKETKAYFFFDSFSADDWEIFEELSLGEKIAQEKMRYTKNKFKEPNKIRMTSEVFREIEKLNAYNVRVNSIFGINIIIDDTLDTYCLVYYEEESSMKVADKEGKFYCQTCKKEVKFGDKFCGNCGGPQMWALF
jgi:hypothetical protein